MSDMQETRDIDDHGSSLQKPSCSQCDSSAFVIPIIYGTPTKELLEQMSIGHIELGGHIMVGNRQPPWTCTQCQILID